MLQWNQNVISRLCAEYIRALELCVIKHYNISNLIKIRHRCFLSNNLPRTSWFTMRTTNPITCFELPHRFPSTFSSLSYLIASIRIQRAVSVKFKVFVVCISFWNEILLIRSQPYYLFLLYNVSYSGYVCIEPLFVF